MILYRPIGLNELILIAQSGYREFPPRLPEQPFFYPVLNRQYAEQIARVWNTKHSTFCGFVTQFGVDDKYVTRFKVQIAGNHTHQELWVPAEELKEFNQHIHGYIEIISAFYGENFTDEIDPVTNLPVLLNSFKT